MISSNITTGVNGLLSANGSKVSLNASRKKHYTESITSGQKDDVSGSFKDMFNSAIGKVNNLQIQSDDLRQKMIYEPESVDIHTVQIAAQKAEIALMFTKTVRDQAIQAYKELVNLR